ncbi:MAG: YibE/F family protein [Actinomycetota bacterium]|nr:YibE/F family protein [Actinomycetota bacterium]
MSDDAPGPSHAAGPVHTHDLADDVDLGPVAAHVRVVLTVAGVLVALGSVLGLVLTWPGATVDVGEQYDVTRIGGQVTALEQCDQDGDCLLASVELEDGEQIDIPVPAADAVNSVDVGEDIVVGFTENAPPGNQYSFSDVDRSTPVLSLLALFGIGVLALSGWKGAASLLSLGLTLLVIGVYVLPALLDGGSPMAVALTTAAVVMLVVMYATYGVSVRSTVALTGTLLGLVLAAGVGSSYTALADLRGFSEESQVLRGLLGDGQLEFQGLLLAGLIIGALGVLDDVTVTQTATVWELAAADMDAPRRSIFTAAMRVGRAHVSATVNTLVLAYVGASLPLLLVLSTLGTTWTDAIFTEPVATEIVRGLAGSLGIIAAVPLTTLIACWAVPREADQR